MAATKLILRKCMCTANVNMVRSRSYKIFQHENLSYKSFTTRKFPDLWYLIYMSKSEVIWGSLWHFPDFQCVSFAENAPFKSSGTICRLSLPFLLPDELLMDITDHSELATKLLGLAI